MESLINQHWTIMGEYDRQHRVKLVVDEWGAWYKPGSEVSPTHLQPRTDQVAVAGGVISYRFPPASVTRLQIAYD